jgi:uncharacterized protein
MKELTIRFEDKTGGGFFSTSPEHDSKLFVRLKPRYDGAEPSGNSTVLLVLHELHQITGESGYEILFEKHQRSFLNTIQVSPTASPLSLFALRKHLSKSNRKE